MIQLPEVGTRNFFLSPQSQLRNLKKALPQLQFCNFLKNVAPQPQLRNSANAIFSEVRNFKSAIWELYFRNFRQMLGVEKLKIIYFLAPGAYSALWNTGLSTTPKKICTCTPPPHSKCMYIPVQYVYKWKSGKNRTMYLVTQDSSRTFI